jgi:hypothetical protein
MTVLLHNITLSQDVYFDDESAEVVISSLRLGDEQDRFVCFFFCALASVLRKHICCLQQELTYEEYPLQ